VKALLNSAGKIASPKKSKRRVRGVPGMGNQISWRFGAVRDVFVVLFEVVWRVAVDVDVAVRGIARSEEGRVSAREVAIWVRHSHNSIVGTPDVCISDDFDQSTIRMDIAYSRSAICSPHAICGGAGSSFRCARDHCVRAHMASTLGHFF